MRKVIFIAVAVAVMILAAGKQVVAGEVDTLVNKLVEKGILNPTEAQIVLDETKQEVAKEMAQGKSSSVPKWAQNIKFKGDLRTRYQWQKTEGSEERNRTRLRFRLGSEMKVNDQVNVAAGLATGGTDPRSTNETLDNTFETPDIRLDYAYASYAPFPWATVLGGKIKNKPFWTPTDLLWDSDINPDGFAGQFTYPAFSNVDLFFNPGIYVLDESGSNNSDPFMYVLQPGFDADITDDISLKTAFTYYGFDKVQNRTLDHSAGTNTLKNGKLLYDYDSVAVGSELGFKNPLGIESIPYLKVMGEYVNNIDPSGDDNGFVVGAAIGDKKVSKKKQWQLKYMYKKLERDAFPDTFSDSDFYDGETNAKGHEAILEYGLFDNVIFGVDYYCSEPISGSTQNRQHLVQTDVVFKF